MAAGPNSVGRVEAPDSGFHAGKNASTAAKRAKVLTLSRHGQGGTTPTPFRAPPAAPPPLSATLALKGSMLPPLVGETAGLVALVLGRSRRPLPTAKGRGDSCSCREMSHRYKDHSIPNTVVVQAMKMIQLTLSAVAVVTAVAGAREHDTRCHTTLASRGPGETGCEIPAPTRAGAPVQRAAKYLHLHT